MNLLITLIGGLVTFSSLIRAMLMAGFCRARIAAIWAAWVATCNKSIIAKADRYIRELPAAQKINQITVTLADDAYEATVTVVYAGAQWTAIATRATEAAANSAAFRCAAANGATAVRTQKINQLAIEANQALNSALAGAPAFVAAFFLSNSASACGQDGSDGSIVTRIYVDVKVHLMAKASTASLETSQYSAVGECCTSSCCAVTSSCYELRKKLNWTLDGELIPEYRLRIDDKPPEFCSEVYDEILAIVGSLDPKTIAEMIAPPPDPSVEEWMEEEAQKWIDELNSAEPSLVGGECSQPGSDEGEGSCSWNPYMLQSVQPQGVGEVNPPEAAENEIERYLGYVDYNTGIKINSSRCAEDCGYEGECAECSAEC